MIKAKKIYIKAKEFWKLPSTHFPQLYSPFLASIVEFLLYVVVSIILLEICIAPDYVVKFEIFPIERNNSLSCFLHSHWIKVPVQQGRLFNTWAIYNAGHCLSMWQSQRVGHLVPRRLFFHHHNWVLSKSMKFNFWCSSWFLSSLQPCLAYEHLL